MPCRAIMREPPTDLSGAGTPGGLLGRTELLEQLKRVWTKSALGATRIVVLRGESGLGKTRIVQAFYEWLSQAHDPEGYWPDHLGREGEQLQVNPAFAPDHPPASEIPWLWLAVRFPDPHARTYVPGMPLSDVLEHLRPHVRPLLQFEARKRLARAVALEAAGNIANVLSLNVPGVVISVINLVEALRADRRVLPGAAGSIASEVLGRREELARQLRGFLEAVLNPTAPGMRHVPVTLFLDDAQWADDYTLAFIESVLVDASRNSRPLLLLCTHWEREWYESGDAAAEAVPPQTLKDILARHPPLENACEIIDVQALPTPALAELAAERLPGLSSAQRQQLAEWVGGTPQLLEDAVALLHSRRRWFAGGDPERELTPEGERRLRALLTQTAHHALVRARFNAMPEEVRELLTLATTQGMRFVAGLAAECARRTLGVPAEAALESIAAAHRPLAVLEPTSESLREFRHRAMYEVARAQLESDYDVAARAALEEQQREVLSQWLESEPWGQLDARAEEELLAYTVHLVESAAPSPRSGRARLRALLRLISIYEERALHSAAREQALRAIEAARTLLASAPNWQAKLPFAHDLVVPAFVLARGGRMREALSHIATLEQTAEGTFADPAIRFLVCLQAAFVAALVHTQLREHSEALRANDRALDASTQLEALAAARGGGAVTVLAHQRSLIGSQRAGLLDASGDSAGAWQSNARLIEWLEQRAPTYAGDADAQQVLSHAYWIRAQLALGSASPVSALADIETTLARLQGSPEPTDDQRLAAAASHVVRGTLVRHLGKPEAARADYDAAIEILKTLGTRHAPLSDWNPAATLALITAHLYRGILCAEHGSLARALDDYAQSQSLLQPLRAALQVSGGWTPQYSAIEFELTVCAARAQLDTGALEAARAGYMRAREIVATAATGSFGVPRTAEAVTAAGLAAVCAAEGSRAAAAAEAAQALSERRAVHEARPASTIHRYHLAVAHLDLSEYEDGDAALRNAETARDQFERLTLDSAAEPLVRHTAALSLSGAWRCCGRLHAAARDVAAARVAWQRGIEVLDALSAGIAATDPRRAPIDKRRAQLVGDLEAASAHDPAVTP